MHRELEQSQLLAAALVVMVVESHQKMLLKAVGVEAAEMVTTHRVLPCFRGKETLVARELQVQAVAVAVEPERWEIHQQATQQVALV
jgi:hypothetical protein